MERFSKLVKIWDTYKFEFFKSILGGAAICLGTYASKSCEFPILAPLLFAVGIFMVMQFNLNLITRHVPTESLYTWKTLIVLLVNLATAWLLGLLSPFRLPQLMATPYSLLGQSIFAGAMIGLVSVNNLTDKPYKLAIATLIMYIFVMLGMPHCVVYAFLHADLGTLLIVTEGNIIGGLIIRGCAYLLKKGGNKC